MVPGGRITGWSAPARNAGEFPAGPAMDLAHETSVSAFKDPQKADVGISCPHVHPQWAHRDSASAAERALAPDRRLIPPVHVPPQPRLRLGRTRKLRGPGVFLKLKTEGQRRVCGCLIMNWRPLPGAPCSRLGVITSRRLGGAVVRSRARRLLREAFRQNQYRIREAISLILVARPSLVGKPLVAVCRDFLRCLREAGLLLDAPAASPSPSPSSPCASSC